MADDEPYELLADGRPTGIVEIPVEWIRDDAPYLMMERYGGLRPYTPPRSLLDIWRDEFDAAHAEGGLFQLTLHPHIIGHRSRLGVLRELLAHITQPLRRLVRHPCADRRRGARTAPPNPRNTS